MLISARSCSAANFSRSGSRIMVPSSLTSSHSTPAGRSPASTARSIAASVCPGRRSTPPALARSGTTWPGRDRSEGWVAGSASSRMVCARSAAEMPVLTPSRASTVTVYAVPRRSWLVWYCGGRSSRSASSSVSGAQTYPEVYRTMNASSSGVACSAAKIRSPSFSRSSSSTTMTALPAAMSLIARSMSSSMAALRSIFSTYLAMTSTSRFTGSPTALAPSTVSLSVVGISPTLNDSSSTAMTVSDTPSTVIEPFSTTYFASSGGSEKRSTSHSSAGSRAMIRADPVDVALHQVPAEPAADGRGAFQVDRAARGQHAERRAAQGLAHHVGGEDAVDVVDDGQADAVDRDRVAVPRVRGDHGPAHGDDGRVAARVGEVGDLTQFLDDAGEHQDSFFCRSEAVKRRSGPICVMSVRSSSMASAMVRDAGADQGGRAVAEQLRRHVADHPVDQAGREEGAGQGRAALEQRGAHAAGEQLGHQRGQVDAAVRAGPDLGRGGDPGGCGAVADPGVLRGTPGGVDHHPQRLR